jgi:hypothetical protein
MYLWWYSTWMLTIDSVRFIALGWGFKAGCDPSVGV